jgi:alpha-ketoglutarate-dependent taurine dioxygenase
MQGKRMDKLQKLLSAEPRAVAAGGEELVRTATLELGRTRPLQVEPAVTDLDLLAWTRENLAWIEARLREHGALLLRGFDVATVPQFEALALAICPDLFGEYGDLPSEQGGEKVYRSTPYPASKVILFHNESSHMHRWPLKQMFFCVQPSQQGGETPIVDCRELYRALPASLTRRFAEKGLLYVRNFSEGLDVSWQDFFRTADRGAVEAYCRRAGIAWEWTGDGLRTRQSAVAVTLHPKTGEDLFFNQLQLHHASCLEPELRDALGALFAEEDFPRNVYYGDGSRIEDAVMTEVSDAYWATSVKFPWQTGDILLLDNMMIAHARLSYSGPRKIVVAMGEMFQMSDLASS